MGFGQQLYNFTPWIDGKQWYLGSTSLNHQSMIFGGYITLHVPSEILSYKDTYRFVNHQIMIIDGIWAVYLTKSSLDGKQWFLGIRWQFTINLWLLVGFMYKMNANYQFMVIGGIWAIYDFKPSLDGERWYLGTIWL